MNRFASMPPPPDASAPGPFRFAPEGALESVVCGAGFSEVTVERVEMTFEVESPDEYLRLFADFAGWHRKIGTWTEAEAARFRAALAEAVQPHVVEGRVRLAATARCASGRR
jgi:hypothetical protein